MNAIEELFGKPMGFYGEMILAIILILIAFKFLVELFNWIINQFGLETRRTRKKREEHELLIATAKNLEALQKRCDEDKKASIKHDKAIEEDLNKLNEKVDKLTNNMLDFQIDYMRRTILDIASGISHGHNYNTEQISNVISVYDRYEQILEENGRTNGQVDVSIEIIKKYYRDM